MSSPHRRRFLTLYNHGQGGVWTWLRADSEEAVRQAYPELQIVDVPPAWIDKESPVRTVDLADDADEILTTLRQSRPELPCWAASYAAAATQKARTDLRGAGSPIRAFSAHDPAQHGRCKCVGVLGVVRAGRWRGERELVAQAGWPATS